MARALATTASLPVPCVLGLVGGLGLVAAYFMPWFGTQGLLLSGAFLNDFLSGTTDLRRVMPGASGDPREAQLLRGLVDLFPVCGGLGAVLAVLAGLRSAPTSAQGSAERSAERSPKTTAAPAWGVALSVLGGLPMVALVVGIGRLPPGSSLEVGLWTIGLGAICLLLGGILEIARRS